MDYIQVTITLSPDNEENREILTAMLGTIGYESFTEESESINAYIVNNDFDEKQLSVLADEMQFSFTFESEFIADKNWNEVWEKNYFKPLMVSGQCLVRAPFHTDYPQAKYEIVIEPNMAFGTGNHETTSLMIEYILEKSVEGKTVLDMGCGTGILAILASMKGAEAVTAIDIDKWSYEGASENSTINKCSNIQVFQGDASLLTNQKFDVIFANIQKNVLLSDMEAYFSVLSDKGLIVMSGFYENDLFDITQKAIETGLKAIGNKTKNKWVAAAYAKNDW